MVRMPRSSMADEVNLKLAPSCTRYKVGLTPQNVADVDLERHSDLISFEARQDSIFSFLLTFACGIFDQHDMLYLPYTKVMQVG